MNNADEGRRVGGIVVPVLRHVCGADADHRKIAEPLRVSIDLRDVSFDPV